MLAGERGKLGQLEPRSVGPGQWGVAAVRALNAAQGYLGVVTLG